MAQPLEQCATSGWKTSISSRRPAIPWTGRARAMATRGEAILERAPVVATLEEAVADCVFVAGTTARTGGLFRRQPLGRPEEIMAQAADALRGGRHVALVFGNETNGLSHEQATLCHALIHIPTSADYAALNLQAVARPASCIARFIREQAPSRKIRPARRGLRRAAGDARA
ncbi:MAG: TrmH family RNA methyltransferase [Gemmataceae bacterium]